jgi:hypothetical protein
MFEQSDEAQVAWRAFYASFASNSTSANATMHPSSALQARRFLWLGVIALAIAGIFATALVIGRAPGLSALASVKEFFHVALVVHVDLSVLIWFLAIGCMGWCLMPVRSYFLPWQSAAFWTIAAATALIALSPLGQWEVLQSNYIPVLNNLLFLLGLGLLAAGLVVATIPVIASLDMKQSTQATMGFTYAAFTTFLALVAFALSAHFLPQGLATQTRFETLFWAGGHILQISFTLFMMAAWLALVELISGAPLRRTIVQLAYILCLVAAIAHASGFLIYPFDSAEFIFYQTRIMISLAGNGAILLAIGIIARLWSARATITRANRAYASVLICSLILFAAGGMLGMMISGQNVTIPAHYHGAIVSVTLALMGLAYAMLPRFGYPSVAHRRLAFWQPIIYTIGQLFHVGGLAYSGGYGVLRKTPGVPMNLAPDVKIALEIMGLGGLLAIIGGLLFVLVMIRASMHRDNAAIIV